MQLKCFQLQLLLILHIVETVMIPLSLPPLPRHINSLCKFPYIHAYFSYLIFLIFPLRLGLSVYLHNCIIWSSDLYHKCDKHPETTIDPSSHHTPLKWGKHPGQLTLPHSFSFLLTFRGNLGSTFNLVACFCTHTSMCILGDHAVSTPRCCAPPPHAANETKWNDQTITSLWALH